MLAVGMDGMFLVTNGGIAVMNQQFLSPPLVPLPALDAMKGSPEYYRITCDSIMDGQ